MNALYRGVTFFDEAIQFFAANQALLSPEFIKIKQLNVEIRDNQKEIQTMHDAFINELKTNFASALSKDRLYNRPCGFLNDQ